MHQNKFLINEQSYSRLEHSVNILKCQKEGTIYSIQDDVYKLSDETRKVNVQIRDLENKMEETLVKFLTINGL